MAAKGKVTAGQTGAGKRRVPVFDSYGRLSRVPETGELEKIEVQHADNRKVIERQGGVLGEEFSDGLSAWRKGVRRPGWEQLLDRVRSGVSDGCVVWHTDRLFRQPRDLEMLIDLAEKGYTVASAHGARDLADPDDRFILRIEVAHAARSSDDTARRIKRRFATKRTQGQGYMGGPRWFGFPGLAAANGDGERVAVSDEVVAAERAAIREAAVALLAGDATVKGLAREWNGQGLFGAKGLPWSTTGVRQTLERPALAGRIVHEGVVVGQMEGEPIVDAVTFDRLQAFFGGRKRGRQPGQRYVASGILRCRECGRGLAGRNYTNNLYADGTRRYTYFCVKERGGCGKVGIDMRGADKVLRELTALRLADPAHAAVMEVDESRARADAVRAEIEQITAIQAKLADRLGHRQLTMEAFDAANEPLTADLARLGGELADLDAELRADTVDSAEGVSRAVVEKLRAEWEAAQPAERRAMLLRALGRHRLMVAASGKNRGQFDPTRIVLRPPERQHDTESDQG